METEKLRILKMLEEKKITADEAARLLEALDRVDSRPSERELKRRWIHIRVQEDEDEVVNIRVPLALLKLGFRLAPHALGGSIGHHGRHAERTREKAEKAKERAVKAHERAERVKERVRRKLQAKFGPDADLDELNGALAEAFEGVRWDHEPEPPEPPDAPSGLGDLDLDIEKILQLAQEEGFDGKLLDVYDEENDKRVTIRLE